MKYSLPLLSLTLALTGCGGAAKPQWENWHATGTYSNAVSVEVDPWGQVVSAGRVTDEQPGFINDDLYATAIDANGKTQWLTRIQIGQFEGRKVSEWLTETTMDDAGNTYLVGQGGDFTDPDTSTQFSFIVKVDRAGQPVWTVEIPDENAVFDVEHRNGVLTLGGTRIRQYTTDGQFIRALSVANASFWDVEVDANGNVYACGKENNVRFNANGALAWSKPNTADVNASCTIDITASGGAAVAHEEYFNDRIQVQVYAANGQRAWQVYIAEPTSNAGSMAGRPMVAEASDGGFLAVTSTLQGRKLVKLSAAGKTVWTASWNDREAWSLETDSAGNAYVYGAGAGVRVDSNGKTVARFETTRTSSEVFGRAKVVNGAVYVIDGLMNAEGNYQGYTARFANP